MPAWINELADHPGRILIAWKTEVRTLLTIGGAVVSRCPRKDTAGFAKTGMKSGKCLQRVNFGSKSHPEITSGYRAEADVIGHGAGGRFLAMSGPPHTQLNSILAWEL